MFATKQYRYELPEELIAPFPAEPRDAARLLYLERRGGGLRDYVFRQVGDLLEPGDALAVNETRVIPARLQARKLTGGRVEVLLLEPGAAGSWKALVRPAKRLPSGTQLILGPGAELLVEAELPDMPGGRLVRFVSAADEKALIETYGQIPLPPYLGRPADERDRTDYQTVYARCDGSVAAPTAGLHFTADLLRALRAGGIEIIPLTLHVGAGTFRPVVCADIRAHHMHQETYALSQESADRLNAVRAGGHRIVAVGTTAVRTLETVYQEGTGFRAAAGKTNIFIYPGYTYRAVDGLITNFHLPESTLLMLVAAFAGWEHTMRAYQYAVANRYRFYSYGDAMLIIDQKD
jgi:S-adenosylmethionine:tRNA ribosyltransferase-isomerase